MINVYGALRDTGINEIPLQKFPIQNNPKPSITGRWQNKAEIPT